MCLAIPGIIIELTDADEMARIDYGGIIKTASTMLLPEAKPGDTVLVHAGFIIRIMDEDEGRELIRLTEELGIGI